MALATERPTAARPAATSRTGGSGAREPDGLRILAWPARAWQNPYTEQLYEHLEALGAEVIEFSPARIFRRGVDVWHVHWPDRVIRRPRLAEALLRTAALFALLTVARRRGIRLVWTVHNLQPHERFHPRLERWFWRAFTRRLDGFIALSEGGRQAARDQFPELRIQPGAVVPHGHYRGAYPDEVSREEARRRLGIAPDARVACFLGQIRTYKGVPQLIRVFRELADPDHVLLVAGAADPDRLAAEVREAAAGDPRVRTHLSFVPDERVQDFLRAADLGVLPYREILNSGSALLALSFDCPVLVPEKGAMGELRERIGDRWVRTYAGELSAEVLEDALRWATDAPRGRCDALDQLGWPALARQTMEGLRVICGRGERRSDAR